MFAPNVRVIVALDDIIEPTNFFPYEAKNRDEILEESLSKATNGVGMFTEEATRVAFAKRFDGLLLDAADETHPIPQGKEGRIEPMDHYGLFEELEQLVASASAIQAGAQSCAPPGTHRESGKIGLSKGDVYMFLGDHLHMGPQLMQESNRLLMFIPFSVEGNYTDNKQLHPMALTELLKGHNSDAFIKTGFAFWKAVESHDPQMAVASSEMLKLCGDLEGTVLDKFQVCLKIWKHFKKLEKGQKQKVTAKEKKSGW